MLIERIGNKVPHPAVIFLILLGAGHRAVARALPARHQRHLPDLRSRHRPARLQHGGGQQPADRGRHPLPVHLDDPQLHGLRPGRRDPGGDDRRRPRRAGGPDHGADQEDRQRGAGLVADLHHRRSSASCRASPRMPATWCSSRWAPRHSSPSGAIRSPASPPPSPAWPPCSWSTCSSCRSTAS